MTTDLFDRYAALDPADTPDAAPDWASLGPVLLAAIDERTQTMSTQMIDKPTEVRPPRRRIALAIAAAFIAVLAIGAVAWLARTSPEPDVVDTPTTTIPAAPTPTSAPAPVADLTGSYMGELAVRSDDLQGNYDVGWYMESLVAWLELEATGDGYAGVLALSQEGFRITNDGDVVASHGGPISEGAEIEWGRFPVVEVDATGDEVTVHWDPSVTEAWNFSRRCLFDDVTFTFGIDEAGQLLTVKSGAFTRTGDTCPNPDVPIAIQEGELGRR